MLKNHVACKIIARRFAAWRIPTWSRRLDLPAVHGMGFALMSKG
jgi:hypothetical protein